MWMSSSREAQFGRYLGCLTVQSFNPMPMSELRPWYIRILSRDTSSSHRVPSQRASFLFCPTCRWCLPWTHSLFAYHGKFSHESWSLFWYLFSTQLLYRYKRPYLYVSLAPFVLQLDYLLSIAPSRLLAISRRLLLHDSSSILFLLFIFLLFAFLLRRCTLTLWVEVVFILVHVHLGIAKLSVHGHYIQKVISVILTTHISTEWGELVLNH